RFVMFNRDKAKKRLTEIRATIYSKRKGPGDLFAEQVLKEPTELLDPEAVAQTDDATDAIESLKDNAITYGYVTTAIVVRDKSHKKASRTLEQIREIIRKSEFMVKTE